MKTIKLLFILSVFLTFVACYQEEDFVGDNIKEGGTYYPVVQDVYAEAADGTFAEGSTVQLTIFYWSRDDVSKIEFIESLDGTDTVINSVISATGYDTDRNVDFVTYNYTIPSGSSGKEISITGTVTTVNDLSKSKSASFTVE